MQEGRISRVLLENAGVKDEIGAPIFIVGLPRSGSTLWGHVISQHPDVALFTEMHFLSPWHKDFRSVLRQVGNLADERNVRLLVDRLFAEGPVPGLVHGKYFWRSIRDLEPLGLADALRDRIQKSENRDLSAIFRILIEEATRCRGKNRPAVKFPVYPAYLPRLAAWWPEGRMLHISRDPRSLAASKTNDPGGTGRLIRQYPRLRPLLRSAGMSFATFQYIWASKVHARMVGQPNYRLFLYEKLLSNPEGTVREICSFCGLDYAESMLSPAAGQASSITGLKSGGFDASRIHGWRKSLSPWEARLISYSTDSSMRRFGYSPDR